MGDCKSSLFLSPSACEKGCHVGTFFIHDSLSSPASACNAMFLHLSRHRRHESTESPFSDHSKEDATAYLSYSYSGIGNDAHEMELPFRKERRSRSSFSTKPKRPIEVIKMVTLIIPLGCDAVITQHSVLRVIYQPSPSARIGRLQMYNASY